MSGLELYIKDEEAMTPNRAPGMALFFYRAI